MSRVDEVRIRKEREPEIFVRKQATTEDLSFKYQIFTNVKIYGHIFSIFIKSFSIFELEVFSRFWAVCKTTSPISRALSPFQSKFSQTCLHQSKPPSKTSIANQFLCQFHPCCVKFCSFFVVYFRRSCDFRFRYTHLWTSRTFLK